MKSEDEVRTMNYNRLLMHAKNLLGVIEDVTDGCPMTLKGIPAYVIEKKEIEEIGSSRELSREEFERTYETPETEGGTTGCEGVGVSLVSEDVIRIDKIKGWRP